MTEALAAVGAVASIVQVVDYGSKILLRLHEFQSKLRGAPTAFQRLQIELRVLLDALKHTQLVLETGAISEGSREALHHAVNDCRVQIENLSNLLAKILPADGDSWRKRGIKAIASLCQDNRVRDIRAELGRCIQVLTYYHAAFSSSLNQAAVQQAVTSPQDGIVLAISPLVQQTQQAFLSTDATLQEHLARIYQELDHHRTLLRDLGDSVDELRTTCSNCGKQFTKECQSCGSPSSTDVFIDCVSRFSSEISLASIHRLRSSFTGSPSYIFEKRPSFDPQRYVLEGSYPFSVVAMKQQDRLTYQYYLLYAQNPRNWQRVIISATFKNIKDMTAIPQVSSPDSVRFVQRYLPRGLTTIITTLLPRFRLYDSVTKFSLTLTEDGAGRIIEEPQTVESAEDCLEAAMSDEVETLNTIELLGCQKFIEHQVEVVSQISSSYFDVKLDGQKYIERKISFATAGAAGENGVRTFINDLKLSHYLNDCAGVSKLIGVVFDDARSLHLKGFLFESPMFVRLNRLLHFANLNSYTIPWPVKALWSAQVSQAVADIHRKGFTIGVLGRETIGLRADGSIILHRLGTSLTYLISDDEQKPPELHRALDATPLQSFNDRTDVFQLGVVL